jgi:hypothetical protein
VVALLGCRSTLPDPSFFLIEQREQTWKAFHQHSKELERSLQVGKKVGLPPISVSIPVETPQK